MVELSLRKGKVGGSNPSLGTKIRREYDEGRSSGQEARR